MHLVRIFMLFTLTTLLLLAVARAGFNLWQFHQIPDTATLIQSFVQGLRFDLATVGWILLIPMLLVPFFSIFNVTRWLAKFILIFWLFAAMCLILLMELVTPYFLHESGVRPDMGILSAIENPVELVSGLWSSYLIPAIIGVVLFALIIFAFWSRLETNRMLRYPIKALPALSVTVIGVALCLLAIHSSIDVKKPTLGVDASLISKKTVVNEIAMNSSFKSIRNLVESTGVLNSVSKLKGS